MSVTDTAKAVEMMQQEGVRSRLAAGDFSDVGGFDLTAEERDLIRDGAADAPEVVGFFNHKPDPPGDRLFPAVQDGSPFGRLFSYAQQAPEFQWGVG